jgi:hypothetical protein
MEYRGKQIKRKDSSNEKPKSAKIASEEREGEPKEKERYFVYFCFQP